MRIVSFVTTTLSATFVAGLVLSSAQVMAQARIYCCDTADGKLVCGDFLVPACDNRPYQIRDEKGEKIGPKVFPKTAADLAKEAADQARFAEETKRKTEERRRNLALLSTYSTEKDIDTARDRAVADAEKQVIQADNQLADAIKNQKKAEGEKEFYKNKALPGLVKKQLADADGEVKSKQDAVAARKADIDKLRNKYEDEKKKFRELKGIKGEPEKPAAAVTAVTAVLPESKPAAAKK
jgi:hypothetical protein